MISGKKLLFHGSLVAEESRDDCLSFCLALAKQVVDERCSLVFGGATELELHMAQEIQGRCLALHLSPSDHLSWYTCATRIRDDRARIGQHYELDDMYAHGGYSRLRTYIVEVSDALITIGGAKGVLDCVEKMRLTKKPFFPVPLGGGESRSLWKQFLREQLPFCSQDAFARLGDQNLSPNEILDLVFAQLRACWSPRKPQVFIVHGHDGPLKYELKDFLQNTLGLGEPIILQDLPSKGRTIIEKLEEYAGSANIAFVLLTPDDKMVTGGEPLEACWRSRQNVILELGYFLAKLNRRSGQVLLLYKGALELPGDISGIVCIPIEAGIKVAGDSIRRELADWLK